MKDFDEYDIKIANYFENQMSPDEEESFMKELNFNHNLKEKFDDEIFLRARLSKEEEKSID